MKSLPYLVIRSGAERELRYGFRESAGFVEELDGSNTLFVLLLRIAHSYQSKYPIAIVRDRTKRVTCLFVFVTDGEDPRDLCQCRRAFAVVLDAFGDLDRSFALFKSRELGRDRRE